MQRSVLIKIALISLGALLTITLIIGLALNNNNESTSPSSKKSLPPNGEQVIRANLFPALLASPLQFLRENIFRAKLFAIVLVVAIVILLVVAIVYSVLQSNSEPTEPEILEHDPEEQKTKVVEETSGN